MNNEKYYSKLKPNVPPDCVMVILGAGGELTHRLLLPTICHLGADGLLPKNFNLVGVAGLEHDDKSFRHYLLHDIASKVHHQEAAKCVVDLANKVHYVKGRFEQEETFIRLKKRLDEMAENEGASRNYIFYLAIPPSMFFLAIKGLYDQGLFDESMGHFRRVIIEKPFGHDLASAIELNRSITALIHEKQIFRIDHYLGKETVQNLLAFRFSNGIFEPIWNQNYIDHVQITVAESSGIALRGKYYDEAGALRDMIPNHAFQLLSLIGMEPPISFASHTVRDEKAKLLRSIVCFTPEEVEQHVVRGQYTSGLINNNIVGGYLEEQNINPDSSTETYVAMKLMIDNWRWAGVPFYIRTGKRLRKRMTEIAIQFKKPPSSMFRKTQTTDLSPNLLLLHIQPEEGISLKFGAKVPGPMVRIGDVDMRFSYKDYFGLKLGTGYETLLYDCMQGDSTLYQRADMVESAWKVVQPILDAWGNKQGLAHYAAGSFGPKEADELMEKDGRSWRALS